MKDFPWIADSVILLRFECTIHPQNFMKIVEAVFQKIKILNFFLMWTTLNFEGRSKTKKKKKGGGETGNICKGTPDIELEQEWSVGATLRDKQKIKNYFSSFKDFFGESWWCHIVGLRMCYIPTKFNQNRWSRFRENWNFSFFVFIDLFIYCLMWSTDNFRCREKTK